jgi:hypothetical protein
MPAVWPNVQRISLFQANAGDLLLVRHGSDKYFRAIALDGIQTGSREIVLFDDIGQGLDRLPSYSGWHDVRECLTFGSDFTVELGEPSNIRYIGAPQIYQGGVFVAEDRPVLFTTSATSFHGYKAVDLLTGAIVDKRPSDEFVFLEWSIVLERPNPPKRYAFYQKRPTA